MNLLKSSADESILIYFCTMNSDIKM